MGADVLPSKKGSPLRATPSAFVGEKNFWAMDCWWLPRMCRAAMRLLTRQRNTLLSLRTAAIKSGGLKEDCETQVTVAAPRVRPSREVRMYIPLVRRRRVFCLVFWSTSHRSGRRALYASAER